MPQFTAADIADLNDAWQNTRGYEDVDTSIGCVRVYASGRVVVLNPNAIVARERTIGSFGYDGKYTAL